LRAYTSGSAHLLRSHTNGTIRTGQIANLALASANPFDLDPSRLAEVHNELTIAGGRVVHDATTNTDTTAEPATIAESAADTHAERQS
ncbi:MAG: amidohydrolase family protein, partial [Brevibacterium sp.]|nr:amidohydrolase family protein [Brevibacterium sp.]MDN5833931.1 amidohydrolase family protein [Brevibacterium sp.]MDN5876600.1 amidohydrolase family protein [Brevibacterium sp.]MDN5910477.1 amidohydrolase family protein [Brevibacterium sp.]MDN6175879.1 amidohydrolase family protein [Brevibacterium sp.]